MNLQDLDTRTARRALGAGGLGLAAQVTLTLATLLIHAFCPVDALLAVALWSAAGVVPWSVVVFLYFLRKLARVELFELDEAATLDEDTRRLFRDEKDARPAARRYERAQRWAVPLGTLLTAGGLLALSWLLFFSLGARGESVASPLPAARLAGLAGALAFAAFVVARYLRALAEDPACRLLGAGGVYLSATVVLLAAVALAFVAAHFGALLPLAIIARLVAVLALLAGVEVTVFLALELFRPRRAGEVSRPPLESRLLGWLERPRGVLEELNATLSYQFGFEVSTSWLWRLIERTAAALLLAGGAVLLLLSSVVVVAPHEEVLVSRFGKLGGEVLRPGVHFTLPWPLRTLELHDVTRLRTIVIGSHAPGEHAHADDDHEHDGSAAERALLWTNRHGEGREELFLVAPAVEAATNGERGARSTGPPAALAGVEVFLQYRIGDLPAFVQGHVDPEARLRQIAELEVARDLLRRGIDELVGAGRLEAGARLRERIEQAARRAALGIDVRWVGIAGVHPAQEVAGAFHESLRAEEEKRILIERGLADATTTLTAAAGSESRARAIVERIEVLEALRRDGASAETIAAEESRIERLLEEAGGRAAERIAAARAERWRLENAEHGRAERFASELESYRAVPRFYRVRRALDVLTEALAEARKIVISARRRDIVIRGDLKEGSVSFEELLEDDTTQ